MRPAVRTLASCFASSLLVAGLSAQSGLIGPPVNSSLGSPGKYEIRELFDNYVNGGGSDTDIRLLVPDTESAKPKPALVLFYGALWGGVDTDLFQFGPLVHPVSGKDLLESIASDYGVVVVTPNYGHAPAVQKDEQIANVGKVVTYLETNAAKLGIDPTRIGLFGYSSGAYNVLSYMLGSGDQHQIDVVIAAGTPVDVWQAALTGVFDVGFFANWLLTPEQIMSPDVVTILTAALQSADLRNEIPGGFTEFDAVFIHDKADAWAQYQFVRSLETQLVQAGVGVSEKVEDSVNGNHNSFLFGTFFSSQLLRAVEEELVEPRRSFPFDYVLWFQ